MHQPPGGVDYGADAVVGGADDPAAVLGGAHAHDVQVLVTRLALAEPAVVREIEQRFGAVGGKAADVAREDGFVADEGRDAVRVRVARRPRCGPLRSLPASVETLLVSMPKGQGTNSPKGTRFTLS